MVTSVNVFLAAINISHYKLWKGHKLRLILHAPNGCVSSKDSETRLLQARGHPMLEWDPDGWGKESLFWLIISFGGGLLWVTQYDRMARHIYLFSGWDIFKKKQKKKKEMEIDGLSVSSRGHGPVT